MSALHQLAAAKQKIALLQQERSDKLASKRQFIESAASDRAEAEALRKKIEDLHVQAAHSGEPASAAQVGEIDAQIMMLSHRASGTERATEAIAAQIQRIDGMIAEAEAEALKAGASFAKDEVEKEAFAALDAALDQVRQALARAIAANAVALDDYSYKARAAFVHHDFFGAAGRLVRSLKEDVEWEYLDDLRPDWLPKHGKLYVDRLRGVDEEAAAIRNQIAEALA